MESLLIDIWKGYDDLLSGEIDKEDGKLHIKTQNFQVIFDIEKDELTTALETISSDEKGECIETLSDFITLERGEIPENYGLFNLGRFDYIYAVSGIDLLIYEDKTKNKKHSISIDNSY